MSLELKLKPLFTSLALLQITANRRGATLNYYGKR